MSHFDFLEKIAEGFVIEAYNSTKGRVVDHMQLDSYDLSRIERALREMKGEEAPSSGARGHHASPATVSGKKRNMREAELEHDGRLAEHELNTTEKHALLDAEDAVLLGLITEEYRANSLFCGAGKLCRFATRNKEKKCGEQCKGTQEARAKCSNFCAHPKCKRGYHASCYSVMHRLVEFTELPALPEKRPKKKQKSA